MPELSDEPESEDDEPRNVDMTDDDFDVGATVKEEEQPWPNPIVKRSSEHDPTEGRSPKRQHALEKDSSPEPGTTKSQTKARDRV